MKVAASLLLLFSTVLPAVHAKRETALPYLHQPDHQTIAAWAEKGWCLIYLDTEKSEKSLAPCKTYCAKHNEDELNDHSCILFGPSKQEVAKQGFLYIDDDGDESVRGGCDCNQTGPAKGVFTVLEGLERIDETLCGEFLSAIELILDVGLTVIPGGQIKHLGTFVKGAKTFAENGLEASSFFDGWITPACGKGWDKEAESAVFGALAEAPDEYGTSAGCMGNEGCVEPRQIFGRGRFGRFGGFGRGGRGGGRGGKDDKKEQEDKEKAEREKAEREKAEREKAEREKAERERTEKRTATTNSHKSTSTKNGTKSPSTSHPSRTGPTGSHKSTSTTNSTKPSSTNHGNKSASDRDGANLTSTNHSRPMGTTNSHKSTPTKDGTNPTSTTHPSRTGTTNSPRSTSTRTQKSSSTPSACETGKGGNRGKGCTGRCSKIQAWEPGTFEDEDPAHLAIRGTGFFDLETRALEKRSSYKPIKVCGIKAKTAQYPSSSELTANPDAGHNITYALTKEECGNFDFRRQPNSKYATTYKDSEGDFKLATEHILEALLIGEFFQNISETDGKKYLDPFDAARKKQVDLCTYIRAFWDVEDTTLQPEFGGTTLPGPQWIADQFPTKDKWTEEFTLLPNAINTLKTTAWRHKNRVVVDPIRIKGIKTDDFLTASSLENSRHVKDIVKFKDVMSCYRYHTAPQVNQVLKKQSQRVSAMLDKLDKKISTLDFTKAKKPKKKFQANYKEMDLASRWDEFMKRRAQDSVGKIDKFFTTHYPTYIQARERVAANLKKAKDNKTKKLSKADEMKYDAVIKYHTDARKLYKTMRKKKWVNPF
ncbi:hypothetical protein FQN49_003693 [Arthroderma sp. PD_2]|nr:hypothetical protein FQN49_003693 [Arthroderma sp. PD_2]